jgi:hypothetical protein
MTIEKCNSQNRTTDVKTPNKSLVGKDYRYHDCGKRLTGTGFTVRTGTDTGERRQVCEYCARFYKD